MYIARLGGLIIVLRNTFQRIETCLTQINSEVVIKLKEITPMLILIAVTISGLRSIFLPKLNSRKNPIKGMQTKNRLYDSAVFSELVIPRRNRDIMFIVKRQVEKNSKKS